MYHLALRCGHMVGAKYGVEWIKWPAVRNVWPHFHRCSFELLEVIKAQWCRRISETMFISLAYEMHDLGYP